MEDAPCLPSFYFLLSNKETFMCWMCRQTKGQVSLLRGSVTLRALHSFMLAYKDFKTLFYLSSYLLLLPV